MDAELRQRRRRHPGARPCLAQEREQRLRAFERLPVRRPERHAAAERFVQRADRDVEGIGNFVEERAALRQPREPRLYARVERGEIARRDLHALGHPGRAGGEEQIGCLLRPDPAGTRRGGRGLRQNPRKRLGAERMLRRKAGVEQVNQHGRLRLPQDLRGTIGRICRVDGDIAAPGLERAEHAGGNARLLVAVDHDRSAVAWQRAAKVRREGVRHAVQRGIAYLIVMIADRDAVRFCVVLQSFQNKHMYPQSAAASHWCVSAMRASSAIK